jgi:hypothetical protein
VGKKPFMFQLPRATTYVYENSGDVHQTVKLFAQPRETATKHAFLYRQF